MSVADQNARESGVEAMRNTPRYDRQYDDNQYGRPPPPSHQPHYEEYGRPQHTGYGEGEPYSPSRGGQYSQEGSPYLSSRGAPYSQEGSPYMQDGSPYLRPAPRQEASNSSLTPLGAAAFPPGMSTPNSRSIASRSIASSTPHSFQDSYVENTNYRYSRNLDPSFGAGIDPSMIADDGDDDVGYRPQNKSMRSSVNNSNRDVSAAAGGAAAGGVLGSLGGLVGRNSPAYNPVQANLGSGGGSNYNLGQEKSEWLQNEQKEIAAKKRNVWLWAIFVALVVIGAIVGGVAGSQLTGKGSSDATTSGASAAADKSTNGDLNKNSAEIKKLLGNKKLHKVFPGVDYTPMYTQYPDCLKYPASQNNVTRDIAVLSQLTNIVRLYGTDCNATEMVIHAIDQLGLKGKMKIWMGVWQDADLATNARQLKNMYSIFKEYGADNFVGIIMGNEVLFREDLTITQLATLITDVKANLTKMSPPISLPVASSDLGDDWTQGLADTVDIVMANIHPFFAGVDSTNAAGWTWSFWQNKDIPLKPNKPSAHIISETGWPSTGGTNCGGAVTCPGAGSVAGVKEMNNFFEDWVCPALTNGTNWFLFQAFDEPWKIKFNEAGKEWEDKWGVMDVDRNLKTGLVIPDCGGKTVDGMTWAGVTLP